MAFTSNGPYGQYTYTDLIYSNSAGTTQTFQILPSWETPAPVVPKPKTAVDWLRERVAETCEAAFDGIAA